MSFPAVARPLKRQRGAVECLVLRSVVWRMEQKTIVENNGWGPRSVFCGLEDGAADHCGEQRLRALFGVLIVHEAAWRNCAQSSMEHL